MRLFIAAWPDDRARDAITGLVRPFTGTRKISWVPGENLHMTLKFLGDLPVSELSAVLRSAEEAASACCPAYLTVEGPGAFPSGGHPRVLVFNFVEDEEFARAAAIGRSVERVFEGAGFPREKRSFVPHVTVGRVRQERSGPRDFAAEGHGLIAVREAVRGFLTETAPAGGIPWDIEELTVVESRLTPAGAEYGILATYPLIGEAGE